MRTRTGTVEEREHQVGTVKFCRSCNRVHLFPRYQAKAVEEPEPFMTIPRFALLLIIGGLSWLAMFYGFMLIAGAS